MYQERQIVSFKWQKQGGGEVPQAVREQLARHAFERVFNMRAEGYTSGELFTIGDDDDSYSGWWCVSIEVMSYPFQPGPQRTRTANNTPSRGGPPAQLQEVQVSKIRATITIHGVDPKLLQKQVAILERVEDALRGPTAGDLREYGIPKGAAEAIAGILNMLGEREETAFRTI